MPTTELGMIMSYSGPLSWKNSDRLLSTVPETQQGWRDAVDQVLKKEASSN